MVGRLACCSAWDSNELLAETPYVRVVLDRFPVTPGHALVFPRRHVDRFSDLSMGEVWEVFSQIRWLRVVTKDAEDFTVAVDDGPAAGRVVPHLHVHVIPRRVGDVADPRGGVRRLLALDVAGDRRVGRRR